MKLYERCQTTVSARNIQMSFTFNKKEKRLNKEEAGVRVTEWLGHWI